MDIKPFILINIFNFSLNKQARGDGGKEKLPKIK